MVEVTNVTGGVITVGENEFIISPFSTLQVPDDRFAALQEEFIALSVGGQINYSAITTPYYMIRKSEAVRVDAAAIQYTATEILGGLINRTPTAGDWTDQFPSPANLVAAIFDCKVGSSVQCDIFNSAAYGGGNGWIILLSFFQPAGVNFRTSAFIGFGQYARATCIVTSIAPGAETYDVWLDLAFVKPMDIFLRDDLHLIGAYNQANEVHSSVSKRNPVNDPADSAVGYTIAFLEAGLIIRSPVSAPVADVLPDATAFLSPCGYINGMSLEFVVRNDGTQAITLTAGAGMTLSPAVIIVLAASAKRLMAVLDDVGTPLVTVYDITT